MSMELSLLGWTLVLAVVQILLPAHLRTREAGLTWNMGPRDKPGAAVGLITGRLARAQKNLFETLPLFAVAVIIAHITGRESNLTLWGARLYLASRIIYVPLYAFGVPVWRSLVWGVGFAGLIMELVAILR